MFGWFKPTCPVDPAAKQWIEQRLLWLCTEFEDAALFRNPVVLPTPKFFPDPYDGSENSVRMLLRRICGYMEVEPERVRLQFYSENNRPWLVNDKGDYLPGTAGLFEDGDERCTIRIERNQLSEPMWLVGTLAHELAHVRLLGERRIDPETFDNELLTDLTVVYRGLGIFLANVPRHWDSGYTLWPGTQLKKPEYMTLPMFGYALAHIAWLRNEEKALWAKWLRLDVRGCFKQGLNFLVKTRDSTYLPKRLRPETALDESRSTDS